MKKIYVFFSIAIFMLAISLTVYAGSIPEDLLHYDDAQIFFGEVIDYSYNKDNPDVSVCPVKKIKGDINLGTKQGYDNANPVGDIDIKPGNVYLFTYFDENNPTDIFEVTSYDTKTLKLKNVTGDMWERFEKYLNEGKYEKAEQDRINKINARFTEVGDEIALSTLVETKADDCTKVSFHINNKVGGYEIDKDEFYKIADQIRLTDIENKLVFDTDDALWIRVYEGEDVYELTLWDNCMVSGRRTEVNSAPTGDYIIKAEDYQKVISLLPEEAQPMLPPLKNLYANFVYWFMYNSTMALAIFLLIVIALIGGVGFLIGYKIRKKRIGNK